MTAGDLSAQPRNQPDDGRSFIYRLTSSDRIRVLVYQEEDLSAIVRIDSQGGINLPLIGDIRIGGMTVQEAQRSIETAFVEGRYLRNPQVTISVEEYAPREVSIVGQVRQPGKYVLPVESTMSVVDLVTRAGGLTDVARGSDIRITRSRPDGGEENFTVDIDSAIRGRGAARSGESTFLLQPGDIVFVPQRLF